MLLAASQPGRRQNYSSLLSSTGDRSWLIVAGCAFGRVVMKEKTSTPDANPPVQGHRFATEGAELVRASMALLQ